MSPGQKIRVLLADDHPVFRMGLRSVLEASADVSVVAEAENGELAIARIQQSAPDVAVLDLEMPGHDGIEVARAITGLRLPVRMVLLTAHKDEALVNKALDSGLHGYVVKDAAVSEIVACVRQVHSGQNYVSPQLSSILLKRRSRASDLTAATPGLEALSPTERRVLSLVAQGKTSREIGEALFISPRTVESHRANIGEKLNLRGTNALITFAVSHRSQLS